MSEWWEYGGGMDIWMDFVLTSTFIHPLVRLTGIYLYKNGCSRGPIVDEPCDLPCIK